MEEGATEAGRVTVSEEEDAVEMQATSEEEDVAADVDDMVVVVEGEPEGKEKRRQPA